MEYIFNFMNRNQLSLDNSTFKEIEAQTIKSASNLSNLRSNVVNKGCRGCGSYDIDTFDNSVLVCQDCGLENERIIESVAEWRSPEASRCMTIRYEDSNLSTKVKGFSKFNVHSNSMKYSNRKKMETDNEFNDIAEQFKIPGNVIHTALNYFDRVSNATAPNGHKLIKRGRNLKGIKAVCLYYSYLQHNRHFKTQQQIADIVGVKLTFMHANLTLVQDILNLNFKELSGPLDFMTNCFEVYNSKYNPKIPDAILKKVSLILKKSQNNPEMQTFMQKSIVCGLFYHVLKEFPKQYPIKRLSSAWGISQMTLQKIDKLQK